MVVETIAWMKIRAMSTDQKLWPAAFLPNANQVPSKGNAQRVPIRRFRGLTPDVRAIDGAFVAKATLEADQVWGASKADLNESVGFYGIKE
jgi:hypothetical protein